MNIADGCVVATDSHEVRDACAAAGARVILTSPKHPSGTDRVAEVAQAPEFRSFDTIINIQGDEPFVSAEAVRAAAALVEDGPFQIGTAAVKGEPADLDIPDIVKVVAADDGRALYFSRAPIPWLRSGDDSAVRNGLIRRHIGVYVYTRDALQRWVTLPEHPLERSERLEQLRPLAAGIIIGVATVQARTFPGIDTENDLEFANANWNAFTSGNL
jgi:3-deoxy-manno-octulosonate cytidylyltransferase (CMP-KDO synthetase)